MATSVLVSYAEAVARLRAKFRDFDSREVNLWIWSNELSAYHRDGSPWRWTTARNLVDVVDAFFFPEELAKFTPRRRYISYQTLADRWRLRVKEGDGPVEAFIQKKAIDPFKLFGFDVLDCSSCPPSPIEARLFALDQVEAREHEWFEAEPESDDVRRKRLCLDAGEAWRKANPGRTRGELLSFLQERFGGEIPTTWMDEIMELTPDIPRNKGGRPRKR